MQISEYYKCIGCDSEIPWDGSTTLCYTCPCGAHIFYKDERHIAFPASFVINLHEKRTLPHLDYLVGESDYTSPMKEQIIKELMAKDCIWMKDCKQCLGDGTYARKIERDKYLATQEAEQILRMHKLG